MQSVSHQWSAPAPGYKLLDRTFMLSTPVLGISGSSDNHRAPYTSTPPVRQVTLPSHHSPWRQSSGLIQLIISVAFTKCPIIQMGDGALIGTEMMRQTFCFAVSLLEKENARSLHSKQLKWPCSPRNEKIYFCNSVQLVLQNVQLHFYIY